MSHILVKTLDTTDPAHPDYTYTLECPGRPHCDGWSECLEKHEVDGRDATDGPDDCADDDPWCGAEEFEFHGVMHTWTDWSGGWSVPFEGCPVRAHPFFGDEAHDVVFEQMPGRYVVSVDWDEDAYELKLVGPEPLPEDGDSE